jgi:hypothetical protein
MKYFLTIALAIGIAQTSIAQFEGSKQVFESPKMKTEIARHRTVAILPFNATISYKRLPKNYDDAANKADEKSLAANMQQGMYTYLLRKSDKYSVSFQDVEKTNILLKKHGLFDRIGEVTADSLCQALGVDAVVKSSYAFQKTSSDGGAIVKTVLLGSAFGKTGNGSLTMQVYNGKDGDLLWRFFKEMNEDVFGSSNELMERMMKKVSRNFPYEK